MQAAFLKNLDHVAVRDVTLEPLLPGEIRLRVDACGVCGTDVAAAVQGNGDYRPFGHEVAGTVVAIGAAVEGVGVGNTVVLESSSACGRCTNCRNRMQERCTSTVSFWPRNRLGMAEEMLAPAQTAVPYQGMEPAVACLAEPLGVALDLYYLTEVKRGDCVLVSGLGPIGLMAVRLAKLSGARRIYACDLGRAEARFELAREFGADDVWAVDETPVSERTFDISPDRIMATSPPAALPDLLAAAAPHAVIGYIGIAPSGKSTIPFDANEFHFKRLQLRGSFAAPALYVPHAVELLTEGMVDGAALISHRFQLADIAEALRTAATDHARAVKVVVTP